MSWGRNKLGMFPNHYGWSTMNDGKVVRDGVEKQAKPNQRSFYNRARWCLSTWDFCPLPSGRLSRYHHGPSPMYPPSGTWDQPCPVTTGQNRDLSVSPPTSLWSLGGSLQRACSGLTHFQLNPGADSIAQRCPCTPVLRFPDFTRLKSSSGWEKDASSTWST